MEETLSSKQTFSIQDSLVEFMQTIGLKAADCSEISTLFNQVYSALLPISLLNGKTLESSPSCGWKAALITASISSPKSELKVGVDTSTKPWSIYVPWTTCIQYTYKIIWVDHKGLVRSNIIVSPNSRLDEEELRRKIDWISSRKESKPWITGSLQDACLSDEDYIFQSFMYRFGLQEKQRTSGWMVLFYMVFSRIRKLERKIFFFHKIKQQYLGTFNSKISEKIESIEPLYDNRFNYTKSNLNLILSTISKETVDPIEAVAHSFQTAIEKLWKNGLEVACSQFEQCLEDEFCQIKSRTLYRVGAVYNWIVEKDQPARKFRLQAFLIQPLLIEKIACACFTKPSYNREILDRIEKLEFAIDTGEQLNRGLSSMFNLPISSIRSLQEYSSQGIKKLDWKDWIHLSSRFEQVKMAELPYKYWPSKGHGKNLLAEWETFLSKINNIEALVENKRYSSIQDCLEKEKELAGPDFWNNIPCTNFDTVAHTDLLDAFSKQVLANIVLKRLKQSFPADKAHKLLVFALSSAKDCFLPILKKTILFNRSLGEMNKIDHWWHSNNKNIRDAINVEQKDWKWLPLFEPVCLDGIKFTPLCTANQLYQESINMQHCVDNYSFKCFLERSHIISVDGGNQRSTLELKLILNSSEDIEGEKTIFSFLDFISKRFVKRFSIHIVQHKSQENCEPPSQHQINAQTLVDLIRSGSIPVDWDRLEKGLLERSKSRDEATLYRCIGWHHTNQEAAQKVIQSWQPALPKDQKGLTYWDWEKSLSLENDLDQIISTLQTRWMAAKQHT